MPKPTDSKAWSRLQSLASDMQGTTRITDLFDADSQRAQRYCLQHAGLRLDYSKTLIDDRVKEALIELARDAGLEEKMAAMRSGQLINNTEGRAVLHIALRDQDSSSASYYGEAIQDDVAGQLEKMESLSSRIRNGDWRGHTGKRIRHLVNIGIGGSDLGPKMICEALRHLTNPELQVHFASSVDETHLPNILQGLSPEETLFSISSKTFTTQETMCNAQLARQWLLDHFTDEDAIAKHCIAVTTNSEAAVEFGIHPDNLLTFWDWVGGRFSLWSSIGFPVAVAIGFDGFQQLLAGANSMDKHFFETDFDKNLPVMLALCGVWHNNFCGHHSLGVIPYTDSLHLLPAFLQQLDMESNGKSIDYEGQPVDYATGPVVWGQAGSNGQHAFFQLLHQGSTIIPLEVIVALNPRGGAQHRVLLSNMLAQLNAFMCGQPAEAGRPFTDYQGNRPSLNIALEQMSAMHLGSLIALYEHKIFVQGILWNLNSFDQWGVQLGKRLAGEIGVDFSRAAEAMDPSTKAMMAWIESRLP